MSDERAASLEESIAQAMETDSRLLPLLPELLADLWELGPAAADVVSVLETVGVGPGARVLDLACGKGAAAVALAERLGAHVEGIDGFPPFVEAATALATERGVGEHCRFRQGDIRGLLGQSGSNDVVMLLSVGPLLGDHARTIEGLRGLVPPGGHIVYEDGFLADGVTPSRADATYVGRTDVLEGLTAFGDRLVGEVVGSREATRAVNERNTERIRERARRLRVRHPDLGALLDDYVARQERETRSLGTDVLCALWVLRRA